ncbi:MAG: hypothetical protein BHV77_08670 [Bacteroides sp. 43_108]|nr:MAG: hypothetical protein BHV77_08670 [Bacteroides sp. 43_108]
MKYNSTTIWQEVKDYLFITLGLMTYSFALTSFMLPYQITTGGVAGIGSIVYYATGFEVQNTFLLINAALLIVAIKELGLRFCMKTIYAVIMMSICIWAFQRLLEGDDGQLPKVVGDQDFMACVIGACLEGIGLAICFSYNGSTGGTDIIAAIINKYRDISLGRAIMFFDMLIVASCYFVFYDWRRLVFGYATLIISSVTLDYVINRSRQSVQFLIFSMKYNLIADSINETGRGVTILDGKGWYTKENRKVLVVLARKRESVDIFRRIKMIDPNAFVSMSNVVGVYGEGFDKIKIKPKKHAESDNQTKAKELS